MMMMMMMMRRRRRRRRTINFNSRFGFHIRFFFFFFFLLTTSNTTQTIRATNTAPAPSIAKAIVGMSDSPSPPDSSCTGSETLFPVVTSSGNSDTEMWWSLMICFGDVFPPCFVTSEESPGSGFVWKWKKKSLSEFHIIYSHSKQPSPNVLFQQLWHSKFRYSAYLGLPLGNNEMT